MWARMRRAQERDRDRFRAESREVGWTAWLVGCVLAGAVVLGALALLPLGQSMRTPAVGMVSGLGGLALARLYYRHNRR